MVIVVFVILVLVLWARDDTVTDASRGSRGEAPSGPVPAVRMEHAEP
jgi:hypothetical protein